MLEVVVERFGIRSSRASVIDMFEIHTTLLAMGTPTSPYICSTKYVVHLEDAIVLLHACWLVASLALCQPNMSNQAAGMLILTLIPVGAYIRATTGRKLTTARPNFLPRIWQKNINSVVQKIWLHVQGGKRNTHPFNKGNFHLGGNEKRGPGCLEAVGVDQSVRSSQRWNSCIGGDAETPKSFNDFSRGRIGSNSPVRLLGQRLKFLERVTDGFSQGEPKGLKLRNILRAHVFEREICSRVKRNNARGGTTLDLQTENVVQYLNPALQGVISYVSIAVFSYHLSCPILRKLKLNIQKRGASSTHAQFLG